MGPEFVSAESRNIASVEGRNCRVRDTSGGLRVAKCGEPGVEHVVCAGELCDGARGVWELVGGDVGGAVSPRDRFRPNSWDRS